MPNPTPILIRREMIKRRREEISRVAAASLVAMALAVSSCATTDSRLLVSDVTITPEMVMQDSPLEGENYAGDIPQSEILSVSPQMSAFLDENVDREGNQNRKLAELVYAVIGEGSFLLSYDDSTRTASGTFEARRGNCISFTNMFVAMARDVGLSVSYQEVEIPPDWSMTGETYLLSEHVNALVDMKSALSRVVDFNTLDYKVQNEARVISDARARAHYYNNIGVEHMLKGETSRAFGNLRQSLVEDKTFSSAWINMGILHRREGFPGYAEMAYKEALRYDRLNLMAMSNLANLYEEVGNLAEAKKYADKVRSHRMNNPYYRYQLANTAFNEGDYNEAISNLNMAIRKRNDDDRFYFLLSLSYMMKGDKKEAERWMKKAEEVAQESESQKKYHRKLDLLMGRESSY